jgi:predicted TIM-barrel fold metal-dependent hydrolase
VVFVQGMQIFLVDEDLVSLKSFALEFPNFPIILLHIDFSSTIEYSMYNKQDGH